MPAGGAPYNNRWRDDRNPMSGLRDVGPMNGPFPAAPTEGMPAAAASPFRSPAAASGVAPTPFNAVMDPSRPGLLGFFGRLAGNPTREEWQAQQVGMARSKGLQRLQEAIVTGAPPQQAILEFVNTPEGMDFFMKDPDPMGVIKSFMEMAQAPDPGENDVKLSSGERIVRPDGKGGYAQIAANPTTEVQTFNGMAELAGLNEAEIAEMARAEMTQGQTGDPTEKEAAAERLFQAGVISETLRDQWISGMIEVRPKTDKFGNTKGFVMIDILNGTATDLDGVGVPAEPVIGDEDYAPGVSAGTTVDEIKAAPAGKYIAELDDPADIVRGAGPMGILAEGAGSLLGLQFPDLAQREVQSQRNGLRAVLADAQNMRDLMSQNSHSSAAETKRIESMVNNLGVLTSPLNAAQSLLDWHQYINQHEEQAQATLDDPNTSDEERGNAAAMLHAIARARANLPSEEALTNKIGELEKEPGMLTRGVKGAINVGKDVLAREGVLDTKPADAKDAPAANGPKTYASEKDAFDAFKRGEFGYDEPVIINGKALKMPRPKGKGAK